MNVFKKTDLILFGFILLTSILIIIGWETAENPVRLFVIRGVIVLACLLVIAFDNQVDKWFSNLIRWSLPIIFSSYFYSETYFYNNLIFSDLDPLLIRWEEAIFGMQPSLEFSKMIPSMIFSEVMFFGYFFFYMLIVGYIFYLFFKTREVFPEYIFYLTAASYLYYLIFAFFPSAGPQFYFSIPERIHPDAYFFNDVIHAIQRAGEQPTGAIPSSHVGVTLVILIWTRKLVPEFFRLVLPFSILLILSTVYIKAHYLIDVFAAILLTPIILKTSKYLFKLMPGK